MGAGRNDAARRAAEHHDSIKYAIDDKKGSKCNQFNFDDGSKNLVSYSSSVMRC